MANQRTEHIKWPDFQHATNELFHSVWTARSVGWHFINHERGNIIQWSVISRKCVDFWCMVMSWVPCQKLLTRLTVFLSALDQVLPASQRGDLSLLLSIGKAAPGKQYWALKYKRDMDTLESPAEGHGDAKVTGEPLLWGKAKIWDSARRRKKTLSMCVNTWREGSRTVMILSVEPSARARSDAHKLKHRRFFLNIRKHFLLCKFPREAV